MCFECECILFSINYTRTSNRVGLLHSDGETEHRGLRLGCAGSLWWSLTTAFSVSWNWRVYGRNCGKSQRDRHTKIIAARETSRKTS